MQTFNQALATLYHKRLITADIALQRSSNVDELKELMDRGSGLNTGNSQIPPRAITLAHMRRHALLAPAPPSPSNLWSPSHAYLRL